MSERVAKKREAARQEILEVARRQMAETGPAALSLRAIAREMGMTAPAIYRYFDSRDALVTDLILEAYTSVAVALEAARDAKPGDPAGQWLAVLLAYRDWALAHPQDYTLVFGTPIPGFVGPPEKLVPAATRAFDVLVNVLAGADAKGLLKPKGVYADPPRGVKSQLAAWHKNYGYTVSPVALHMALIAWTRIHGLTVLELFYFIQPFFGDVAELYKTEALQLVAQAGLKL